MGMGFLIRVTKTDCGDCQVVAQLCEYAKNHYTIHFK